MHAMHFILWADTLWFKTIKFVLDPNPILKKDHFFNMLTVH